MTAMALPDVLPAISNSLAMKLRATFFLLMALLISLNFPTQTEAKKIRKVFKTDRKSAASSSREDSYPGLKVEASEKSFRASWKGNEFSFCPDSVSFSGYDKNISSPKEAFLITNGSTASLQAVSLRIDYFDMNGLMLHSRTYSAECLVPPGETRKIDIPTWDRQNSFYYYLSNEPKKVATPYKVTITPLSYWVMP